MRAALPLDGPLPEEGAVLTTSVEAAFIQLHVKQDCSAVRVICHAVQCTKSKATTACLLNHTGIYRCSTMPTLVELYTAIAAPATAAQSSQLRPTRRVKVKGLQQSCMQAGDMHRLCCHHTTVHFGALVVLPQC